MNLSKNLQHLRKRDRITQEELADRLDVTRQSVSKWETGEAYPETDKLIMLCDIFKVSLDDLIRGDLTSATDIRPVRKRDECGFGKHMDKFSRAMATGVFLILTGVAICVLIAGISVGSNSTLLSVMSGVIVLVFVAAALFLFVFFGMSHDAFKKQNPVIECEVTESEAIRFNKKFNLSMALLVSGIVADVAMLVVFSALIDADIIRTENADAAYCFVTAAFLSVLAFIVGDMTYLGIQRSKYDVASYNKQTDKELNPSPAAKIKDALCGAVMLAATALFLLLGFLGNLWHPAWIVFPVGGIICAIISVIFDANDKRK